MDLGLYFFLCVVAVSYSEKEIPKTKLGVRNDPRVSEHKLSPLIKHGVHLDSSSRRKLSDNRHHGEKLGIIGGRTTNITQHSYQVAINEGKAFVCAGALLNRIWVIALASCTAGSDPSELTVRVGSNDNIYGGTLYNVSEIVVHPNYNYSSMDYDFALLKLNTYICFDIYVGSVSFSATPPQNNYLGIISGWGADGANVTSHLRELQMRAIYNKWCANKYSVTHDVITTQMFCIVNGTSGPCYNDFGDPYVVNGTLYGLFSWSRGCANPDFPAVCSNIASASDWIHTTMNNACTCGVY